MESSGCHTFVDDIDDVLPQTQCRRCGHDGCRPYAEAVAAGAAINRCPPGGDIGIVALAQLTGRAVVPLDPDVGVGSALMRAEIDESVCIGCTLCIDACPVDAIVGGPKRMHDVIAALCTGCELCIAPCPVDCITLVPAERRWSRADAHAARQRHDVFRARAGKPASTASAEAPHEPRGGAEPLASRILSQDERTRAVMGALQRARARRVGTG